jgi:ligand-binding sensor domain-containing protein
VTNQGFALKTSGRLRIVRSSLAAVTLLCILAAAASAKTLPVRIFTSADGLSSSFVNHLMRDSRGFLWFATRDGLSRFDGTRFLTYQVGTQDAPPGIENIFESSNGIYWIVTTGGLTPVFRLLEVWQSRATDEEPRQCNKSYIP